jgi:outer membrane receptor for ferrienterochelin and colicin
MKLSTLGLVLFVQTTSSLNRVAAEQISEEDYLAQVYGDTTTVSIATGNRQPLSKAPADASMITANDIKAMAATDLDEVLETVPGLNVARSNIGYNPFYSFRGIYSGFNPQVLVLINGSPISHSFTGDRNQMAACRYRQSPASKWYAAPARPYTVPTRLPG